MSDLTCLIIITKRTKTMSNCYNNTEIDPFEEIIIDTTHLCHQRFDLKEAKKIRSNLNKLKDLKTHYGRNHPSMSSLLNFIAESLAENSLSEYSILFFLEQLRIETYYLGNHHHDLAYTLNRIGEIHCENHQILEAAHYFSESMVILKTSNKKGALYAKIICNIGVIEYHQSFYYDAFETFNLAIIKLRDAVGNHHSDVSEMLVKVAEFQLETGKLVNANDNYAEALAIQRFILGHTHFKVSDILIKIGLIHKLKSEYDLSLDFLYQALSITRNLAHAENSTLVILHEMCSIYQFIGDVENAIKISQKIIEKVRSSLGEKHVCVVFVLALLRNIYIENGMIENSIDVSTEIQFVIDNSSSRLRCKGNSDFLTLVMKLFAHEIDSSFQAAAAA